MTALTSASHGLLNLYAVSAAMYPSGLPPLILRPVMKLSHFSLRPGLLITANEFLRAAVLKVLEAAVNIIMWSFSSARVSVGM